MSLGKITSRMQQVILENKVIRRLIKRPVSFLFQSLVCQKTNNFSDVTWLGYPVWQNVLDLWTTQEVISAIKPELIIECGTNRGGAALFYAQQLSLLEVEGQVITIDIESMHKLSHPRIEFIIGSSLDDSIVRMVSERVAGCKGPVLVILDSAHDYEHVIQEIEIYSKFVTSGSYVLVQDGATDTVPHFRSGRPGPLPAIEKFVRESKDFTIDFDLCDRFLITHHPKGWLKKQ